MHPSSLNTLIGKNIRRRRRLQNLSQTALGRHLGVSFQQVQKYENGRNSVSGARLWAMAALLDCRMDDFFAEEDALRT